MPPDYRDQLQAALGAAYVIERELGGGGMSSVFLAEETALGRKVVIKVLPPDLLAGVSVDRFKREIQLAAKLQQAQIVPVLATGEVQGIPYFTMPFVEGESLRAKLGREGALPVGEVLGILRDVTRALAYAHDHGVVHRDIKPDNVLLSGGTAVVTDFGIAKAISAARESTTDTALTQMGTSIGTPAYISPEQAAGDPDVDHRADLYSLGCMAYELLVGEPPFHGRSPQRTMAAHLTEVPAPVDSIRKDVPASLADLIAQLLEKDPAARPESARELAAALDDAAGAMSGVAPVMLLSGPGAGRRALLAFVAASVVVGVVAKAAVIAFGLPDWVFVGSLVLIAIGIPVALATAYAHRTTRRVATRTPALTQGGSPAPHGTMATLALRASPHLTWRRSARLGLGVLGAFVAVIAVIMGLRLFGIGPAASLLAAGTMTGRERVLIVDFKAGKDTSLSHVVTEAVRTNLGQSSVISIMPPSAVTAALQRMQRAPTTPVDERLAREIAQREGAKAYVTGEVSPLGGGFVVSIKLVSADSGASLAAFQTTVDKPSELLDAIDKLTRKLRGRIGESLKTVRDAPALDEVTTSSLDALRKYAEASRAIDIKADYTTAAALLREAVALDTTFAMAYRKLGVALLNLGMPRVQSDSAFTRAYALRERLSEKERYLTIAAYYSGGPGLSRQKSAEAYERVLAIDPTDVTAATSLAGNLYSRRQFKRADSIYTSLATGPRPTLNSLRALLSVRFNSGHAAEAESVYAEIVKRFPDAALMRTMPAYFAYQRGQYDSVEAFYRVRRADAEPLARIGAIGNLSALAMLRGRLKESESLRHEAFELNAARGVPNEPITDVLNSTAVDIWFRGEKEKGVAELEQGLAKHPLKSMPLMRRPYPSVAVYYAWAGRPDKARAVYAQWIADVKDTTLRGVMGPAKHGIMAEILLAEKKPLEAIREIYASDSLPDGPTSDCPICIEGDLGRAYDLANQPDQAIAHFERFVTAPYLGRMSNDVFSLAGIRKRLGELYEAKGDQAHAATHYRAFVDLWKNADPDLQPQVEDVKRRLARLRGAGGL